MFKHRLPRSLVALAVSTALGFSTAAAAKDQPAPQIPKCEKRIGTLAVREPETRWWQELNLESPEALIKHFVSQSNCFSIVDRGKGLAAAKAERALAGEGELRGGSNLGKGQMKAADYVLVPDIVNQNSRASGKNIGGILGGVVGGLAGAVLGGISMKSKTASVMLTLTDVRSTEQVSLQQGSAKKTDIGWGGGGGGFFGGFAAAGVSSYANTEIGQVVTMAYLDAFVKLVNDVKAIQPDAKADNVTQAVTMAKPGKLYENPDIKAAVVRDLDPGMTLYPTGEKQGLWWKASDELGNEGWVPSTLFQLAK
jgi:curli biogenesis system outer membrane secretion channel CsgG